VLLRLAHTALTRLLLFELRRDRKLDQRAARVPDGRTNGRVPIGADCVPVQHELAQRQQRRALGRCEQLRDELRADRGHARL